MWIEIFSPLAIVLMISQSPPIRRCGLKSWSIPLDILLTIVTSHTEVWIEINPDLVLPLIIIVTSHTEVWIEINTVWISIYCYSVTSHTEVWIEITNTFPDFVLTAVTSHTEVWIEIGLLRLHAQ